LYYNALIQKIEKYRNEDLLEFYDEFGNEINREEIEIEIEKRFNLFLLTKNLHNFREFFENWGLLVNVNENNVEEMVKNAKDIILLLK